MTARASFRDRRAMRRQRPRAGVTLIELLVVVVVLGLVSSVAMLAMPRRSAPPDDTAHRIANARTQALRTGRPVSVVLQLDTVFTLATAMPDGSVLADPAARIERLTGQPLGSIDSTSQVRR